MVGITPGVQNLQRNLAARCVHGLCHHLMAPRRARRGQGAGKWLGPTSDVGRKAAGHHQAHFAFGAFAEIRGEFGQVAAVFQPGVHGAHQYAVFELREAQIQRSQQVRIQSQAGL